MNEEQIEKLIEILQHIDVNIELIKNILFLVIVFWFAYLIILYFYNILKKFII